MDITSEFGKDGDVQVPNPCHAHCPVLGPPFPEPTFLPANARDILVRFCEGPDSDHDLWRQEGEHCTFLCWRYVQERNVWRVDEWGTMHKLCLQINVIGPACRLPRPYNAERHRQVVLDTVRTLLAFSRPGTGTELGSPITSVLREFTHVLHFIRQWQVCTGPKQTVAAMSEMVLDALRLASLLLRQFLEHGYSANEHSFHRHLRCDTPLDRIVFMIWNIHIHDSDFAHTQCSILCRQLQEMTLILIQYGGVLCRWRHLAELFLFRPREHQYYMDVFLNASAHQQHSARLRNVFQMSTHHANDYSYPGNSQESAHERKLLVEEYAYTRLTNPRCLRQLARLVICTACRWQVGRAVRYLPLPEALKAYILSLSD